MTPLEQHLLQALQRAASDLEAIKNDDRGKVDPAWALDRVRAAIAKAEGRS